VKPEEERTKFHRERTVTLHNWFLPMTKETVSCAATPLISNASTAPWDLTERLSNIQFNV
jgi:hypothetical protein